MNEDSVKGGQKENCNISEGCPDECGGNDEENWKRP